MKPSPVRQRATAAYEAMGESDIVTGSDGQIHKIEYSFSLRVWLPLVPTAPVCFGTFILHWRQNIEDHQVC